MPLMIRAVGVSPILLLTGVVRGGLGSTISAGLSFGMIAGLFSGV